MFDALSRARWLAWPLALLLFAGAGLLAVGRWPHELQADDLGMIRAYPAWLRQQGLVFLFSGADGWSAADARAARSFARRGYYVAGIDSARFLAAADRSGDCLYLPAPLEAFSRAQQRAAGLRSYAEPLLLGRGAGASLVYMAQLQAPPLAFAAAVALDPEPRLPLSRSFCDHAAASSAAHALTLAADAPGANVPLRMLVSDRAAPAVAAFAAAVDHVPRRPAAGTPSLTQTYTDALRAIDAERPHDDVADLPLVEVKPAQARGDALAILYSGDGGWRDLDQRLAGTLADKGMPVVGVDVLRYYWHVRAPPLAARDLARIMRHYQQAWHRDRVLLIGFSFGANVLPFLYNRLPPDLRGDVQLLTLLSPERRTAFEVDPRSWFGTESTAGQVDIAPELAALPAQRVLCIYGADEAAASLCTLPAAVALRTLRKPGGHHFDEDYDRLADDILAVAR